MGGIINSLGAGMSGGMSIIGNNDAVQSYKNAKSEQTNLYNTANKDSDAQYARARAAYSPYSDQAEYFNALLQSAILGTPAQYKGKDGTMQTVNPSMNENPALKYQNVAYNRALASRGLLGSGQAAYGKAALAANGYNDWLGRLGSLVDLGKFGTTGIANAAVGQGNQIGSLAAGYLGNNARLNEGLARQKSERGDDMARWNYESASQMGNMYGGNSKGGAGF